MPKAHQRGRGTRPLIVLACVALLGTGCGASESAAPEATKGFINFFAEDANPNYTVTVNGQVVGKLTRQYTRGGCFQNAGSSLPPDGTVTQPIFRGQSYSVRVQYDNGTSDAWSFTATQDQIDAFCTVVGVSRN